MDSTPIQELPVVVIDAGRKAIYAFELELDQHGMDYDPALPGTAGLAAPRDVVVYADTVTLRSRIVLPGRSLSIVARSLVLGPGAEIDTTGASSASSYAPGDLPQQMDQGPGARGCAGADGSAGGTAGAVSITVDEIQTTAGGPWGEPQLQSVLLPQELARRLAQALASFGPITLAAQSVDMPNIGPPMVLPATSVDPGQAVKLESSGFAADFGSIAMVCSTSGLTLSLPGSFEGPDNTRLEMPYVAHILTLRASVQVSIDDRLASLGAALVQAQVETVLDQVPKVDESWALITPFIADILVPVVSRQVEAAFAARLKSLVDQVLQDLNGMLQPASQPALVVRACGHAGGRGQDGHGGVKGSAGENGKKSDITVVTFDGRYTSAPAPVGKTGGAGGQAGDAGHSGEGGHGGAIVLNWMRSAPIRLVLDIDGGPGGEPAAPGALGDGGRGGDGGEFYLQRLGGFGQLMEVVTGDDGSDGLKGAAAGFAGAMGGTGNAGSVQVNGASFAGVGPSTQAYDYERMAPLLQLDQLLMVQRMAKLIYLKAQVRADFDRVATLFLWLCNVWSDSISPGSATAALPAPERNARAAIRASAQMELLRLHRGIDYFGHPANWAPVLRLQHIQARATELIALGKLVEQQHEIFVSTNAAISDKLQALDDTLRQQDSELKRSASDEQALDDQIADAEAMIAALQTDLDAQVGIIERNETEVARAIEQKLSAQCSLGTVLKIVMAVVEIAAGVITGVSEIAGAATLAVIIKEAQAAATAAGHLKTEIEDMIKTTATVEGLLSRLGAVNAAIAAGKPDAVKIAVVRDEFEQNIRPLITEFPIEGKELRSAVRALFDLVQTRNEKIIGYNALYVQKAQVRTHRAQVQAHMLSIAALREENRDALVPVAYLSFFRSALAWSKENVLHQLYQQTRALCYHMGTPQRTLIEDLNDLDIASLADTQARLLTDYDQFLEQVGRPLAVITDVKTSISRQDQPSLFETLASNGRITFTLGHMAPEFDGMTLVKVDAVEVRLPEVQAGSADELNVALLMTGTGAVWPVDNTDERSVVFFDGPPRPLSFIYSFDPQRTSPVVQAARIADDDFAPLSPFTTWTLDFGVHAGLNRFVDFEKMQSIELHFSGHAFGRRA